MDNPAESLKPLLPATSADAEEHEPKPTTSATTVKPRRHLSRRNLLLALIGAFIVLQLAYESLSGPNTPLKRFTHHCGRKIFPAPSSTNSSTSPECSGSLRFFGQRSAMVREYCASSSRYVEIPGEEKMTESDRPDGRLRVEQISTPPREDPRAGIVCEQILMHHTFSYSYGKPFIGVYSPPEGCEFNTVVLNLTMTSEGRQFDRLAHFFLSGIEIWRTSTAEPTKTGVVTEHLKDATKFLELWKKEGSVVFDLGNLVNEVYTGSFDITLTVMFYNPLLTPAAISPPDLVLPYSSAGNGVVPLMRLPGGETKRGLGDVPKNTVRLVATLFASGNAEEEFWYGNVPAGYEDTFKDSPQPGQSAFRELQLILDDKLLAGAAWPEVTVFTGGIVPSLWRPIVATGAFDLPSYDIDLTPLLPVILDGEREHDIQIRVMALGRGGELDEVKGKDWIISGYLSINLDSDPHHVTTGEIHKSHTPAPKIDLKPTLGEANSTLETAITARRTLSHLATINTSAGKKYCPFTQTLMMKSSNQISEGGEVQKLSLHTFTTLVDTVLGTKKVREEFVMTTTTTREPSSSGNGDDDGTLTIAATVSLSHAELGGSEGLLVDEKTGGRRVLAGRLKGNGNWRIGQGGEGKTGVKWGERRGVRGEGGVWGYGRVGEAEAAKWVKGRERVNGKVKEGDAMVEAVGGKVKGEEEVEEMVRGVEEGEKGWAGEWNVAE